MGCLCGCKYGRKTSHCHAGALHSFFLASDSLNLSTESGTDDWAQPVGLEGLGGGEAPETEGQLRCLLARQASTARRLEAEQLQIICRFYSVDYA